MLLLAALGVVLIAAAFPFGGPANTALADPLIVFAVLLVVGPVTIHMWKSLSFAPVRIMLFPLTLFGFYTSILVLATGAQVIEIVRVIAFAFYLVFAFALGYALCVLKGQVGMFWVIAASQMPISLLVLTDSQARAQGTFSSTNYAANYVASALLAAVLLRPARNRRGEALALLVLGVMAAVAIWRTQSFGTVVALLAVLVFALASRVLGGRTFLSLTATVVATAVVSYFILPVLDSLLPLGRLERSATTRQDIWSTGLDVWIRNPFGVGPGGVPQAMQQAGFGLQVEIHNDVMGFLVESGPIGVVLVASIIVILWRFGSKRTRALLVFMLAAGLTRQVFNFRHLWILLGLTLAVDFWERTHRAAAVCRPHAAEEGVRSQLI